MLMDPAQGLFGPIQLSPALIVENTQGHEVDRWRNPRTIGSVGREDAADMRSMKAGRGVVVRPRIVFGKVPTTDDTIARSKAATEGSVIPSDAAIDDRHRLPAPLEPIPMLDVVPASLLMGGGRAQRHPGRCLCRHIATYRPRDYRRLDRCRPFECGGNR
jgi:hypothetical protein